jgi:hypothetical protein
MNGNLQQIAITKSARQGVDSLWSYEVSSPSGDFSKLYAFTVDDLCLFASAIQFLAKHKLTFLANYGYGNAIQKARELGWEG